MGSTEKPLVSILTPSFDQGRFIQDCIDSVAAQTYSPIEHIVMDGGSTDETLSILQQAPSHVRWVSEPDRGQSHALNKALALSRGDIIGWVNSDDAYADRRAVEWAVEGLQGNTAAVFGHALLINEYDEVLQVLASFPFWKRLLEASHYVCQPTFFFSRQVIGAGLFVREDLNYVMDRDLLLRLAGRGRIRHLGRVIAADRHQSNRKVLSPQYLQEAASYDRERGIRPTNVHKLASLVTRYAMRMYGILPTITMEQRLQPAFALLIPPLSTRLLRQSLIRRSSMPLRSLAEVRQP